MTHTFYESHNVHLASAHYDLTTFYTTEENRQFEVSLRQMHVMSSEECVGDKDTLHSWMGCMLYSIMA